MRTVRCLFALLFALNFLGLASPALALPAAVPLASPPAVPEVTASISVTTKVDEWNDTDNGQCSLREALERVYNNVFMRGCPLVAAGATYFTILMPDGTYPLNRPEELPDLGGGVTINIISNATIDGGAPGRNTGILEVLGATVNLKNLKFTNGVRQFGGALTMGAGEVNLDNVKFINNGAVTGPVITQEGGAINVSSGTLSVYSSLFQGNHAKKGGAVSTKFGLFDDVKFINNQAEVGGALFIWDQTAQPVVVQKSEFKDNKSIRTTGGIILPYEDEMGGGAVANNGNLKMVSTLVKGNQTQENKGGAGLWNDAGATAWLEECVFTQNNAHDAPQGSGSTRGGAIFNEGTLNLVRCSIHGNTADRAGAIFNHVPGHLYSYNTTIANNNAILHHGGLMNEDGLYDEFHYGGLVELYHTTIAKNTNGSGDPLINNRLMAEENYSIKLSNSIIDTACAFTQYTYGRSIIARPCVTQPDPQNGWVTATDFISTGVPAIQLQGLTNGNSIGNVAEFKVMKIGNGIAVDIGRNDAFGCNHPLINHKDQNLATRSAICDAGAIEGGINPPQFFSSPPPGVILMPVVDLTQSGDPTFVDLTLQNTGGGAMTYEFFDAQGSAHHDFVTTPGPTAGNLFTGQQVTLRFNCSPTIVDDHWKEIYVVTNAPNKKKAEYSFLCVGSGTAAQASMSQQPGPDNLPGTQPGGTTQTDLSMTNHGQQPMTGEAGLTDTSPDWGGTTVPGLQGAGDIQGPSGPNGGAAFTLNPGQSVDFHITCTPPGPGVFVNTWRITTSDPNHPLIDYPLACLGLVDSPPESLNAAAFANIAPASIRDVAISPEGANLLAGGDPDNDVRIFTRNALTGGLSYFGSYAGEPGMTDIFSIEYSHDGQKVYYTSRDGDGIVMLNRSGSFLTHDQVMTRTSTYVCGPPSLFCPINAMDGAKGLAVSPDDEYVYVAGYTDHTLTVLRRSFSTDSLRFTQRITRTAGTGVNVLGGATRIAVSPDGQHVYVVAETDDTLAVFQRMVNGHLSFQGAYKDGDPGLSDLNWPADVAVSPDGNFVYLTANQDHAINVFRRDSADGLLTLSSVVSDVVDAWGVALTSDPAGERLFHTQYGGNKVEIYGRDEATGALTRVSTHTHNPPSSNIYGPDRLAVSPDNLYVYAALYDGEGVRQFATIRHPPVVTFISPASAVFGGGDFELTVHGGRFYPDTRVVWDDAPLATEFVSENELRASVPAAYIASAGNHDIVARTTVPGGGDSAPVVFAVLAAAVPPTPSIASLEPPAAEFGAEDLLVVVHGANFSWDSHATYNGQPVPTVFFDSHTLEIYLSAALLTEPGTGGVEVTNSPSPGATGLGSSPRRPRPARPSWASR
jgi:6-phosphogluconolactonase (cycloisomerase 2 family)